MDQFKVHLMGNVIRKIQDCGTEVDFCPAGYTSKTQVMDVSVNKPFKDGMRELYEEWMAQPGDSKKVTRLLVAQWVDIAWSKITEESIRNGWRACVDSLMDIPPIVDEEEAVVDEEEMDDDEEEMDVDEI